MAEAYGNRLTLAQARQLGLLDGTTEFRYDGPNHPLKAILDGAMRQSLGGTAEPDADDSRAVLQFNTPEQVCKLIEMLVGVLKNMTTLPDLSGQFRNSGLGSGQFRGE